MSNKMFKYKEKRVSKSENKIQKKKRKHSASSSLSMDNDSDDFEWVEKVENRTSSLHIEEKIINNKTQEEILKRNEWMNTESFLPCFLNKNKQKLDVREINKTEKLDKPGQNNKELNPYWKDGGNGLPPNNMEKLNSLQIMDVNWLKKSLRRAEEQALRDNKSLGEIAAERWGSLETIQLMIAKAEKQKQKIKTEEISEVEEAIKSNYKKDYNDKKNQDLNRNSGIKNNINSKPKSETKTKSSTQENEKYIISNYQSQYKEQQQTYQKHNNFLNQTSAYKSSSHIKNWKKDKNYQRKCEIVSSISDLEKTNIELNNSSNTNEVKKNKSILTEAEMNKLGARIIKAELIGDNKLAGELKIQLEKARKVVANNINMQEKTIILTKIDAKDFAKPIQLQSQYKQFSKDYKKKIEETHLSNERICHFINNDKYSLQEMFQHEKEISTNECDTLFTKIVSKSIDMDDISDKQITSKKTKQVKRDCAYAIKDSSKYMDNCWWCLDSNDMLKHMIITMDSMICLSLPAYTSLTINHCILTPTQHIASQLQLDEDVWERLKELKTKLIKMFTSENLYPIFFEIYKKYQKYSHMQLQCIPLPKKIGELAPIYFKKALSECETEWSVNKKIIDLKYKNIRHAVPNGLSYFIIEFASHPGYAHVIENEEIFPKKFAEEVIGGMLDLNCNLWRKPKKQSYDEQIFKVLEFTKLWKKYNSF